MKLRFNIEFVKSAFGCEDGESLPVQEPVTFKTRFYFCIVTDRRKIGRPERSKNLLSKSQKRRRISSST